MKPDIRTLACAALIFLAACGGRQTMASKSARAFEKTGGRMERAAHQHGLPGSPVSQLPGDERAMQHDGHAGAAPHDAMKHDAMQHDTVKHDRTQRGATMQHDMPHHTAQPRDRATAQPMHHDHAAQPRNREPAQPTDPASILKQDEFDAPAPRSVSEAKKKEQ